MIKLCTSCGAALETAVKFCSNCGAQVTSTSPQEPQALMNEIPAGPSSGDVESRSKTLRGLEATSPPAVPSTRNPAMLWGTLATVAVIIVLGVLFFVRSHGTVSDEKIVQNIKAAFFDDVNLHRYTIEVAAKDRIVTLVGLVNTDSDKANAIQIARQQEGVVQVMNRLVLSGVTSSVDAQNTPKGTDGHNLAGSSNQSGQTNGTSTETVTVPANQEGTAPSNVKPASILSGLPTIVQAIVKRGGTSLVLQPGAFYIYGMATGGAAPSSPFNAGQFAQAVDAAGQMAAALADGSSDQNGYTTDTGYHDIGGVSIAGQWETFRAFYGSNSQPGASTASVVFPVPSNSLVVVVGLAAGQQDIQLLGIPGLEIDAPSPGSSPTGYMTIAHAYLTPGAYTVTEHSTVLAAGQDPEHMADLIGVFIFGGKG